MPIRHTLALCCALWLTGSAVAQAHFLWLVSKSDDTRPTAAVYFSENASPDDPDLLDKVLKAEAFALAGRRGEAQALSLAKSGDALVAELTPEQRQAPIILRHTYGAMTRGGDSFLLKYYAKTYPTALPGTWRAVKDGELLPLEVVPVLKAEGLDLKVLWQGEPLLGATVTVEGPGIDKKLEGTTGEGGVFNCKLPEAGLYSIRAKHSEDKAGEFAGTAYKSIRHYSTLSLRHVAPQLRSVPNNWPALTKGVTSFGGAVVGDSVYVYGGHYGSAHEYYHEDQSGDFYRLNLRDPQQWDTLPGGPKLTGLALVPHGGKLYRVGGFTAKNAQNEPESLWSQSDFARFDPAVGQWETLPALPEGRSSHDAAVVGNTLYVVGGWLMAGSEPTRWHDTALAIDLSARSPEWRTIPQPPFHRRAVALAAWNDKLYVIGGMQEKGGPTTAIAVFDPASGKWSEGPALQGTGMDGFGSSAFACGGRLFATTMSGSVQRLSATGDQWEFVGQLAHPRFFHRLLPWNDDRLVIVGGASMTTGKTKALELIPVAPVQAAAR